MNEEMKQQLIDEVINELIKDVNNGDLTVLEEILFSVPDQTLIHSLSEERWSEFEK